jgi:hypothetical protein
MNKGLLFMAFLCTGFITAAQKVKHPASKMKFDIGPQFSYPINNSFNTTHSIGIGATSRAAYYFTNEISTGIRVNYDYFIGRKYSNGQISDRHYNLTWTSFLANLQYDFDKNIFIGGDAGIGLLSQNDNTNSMFNSSLYIGYAFKILRSSMGVTLYWTQARESSSRDETIGVRLCYRFN